MQKGRRRLTVGGLGFSAVRQSIGSLVAVEWEAILEGCRFKDMED